MNNIFLRFFSSILISPIFLYIIYLNSILFHILILLIFFFCIFEIKFLFKKNLPLFIYLFMLFVFFLFSLISLRGNNIYDFLNLAWIIMIVWTSDIGGYVFGKTFGGKKFSKWSPNKTYIGLFGSFFLSQFSFLIIFLFDKINFSYKIFIIQFLISSTAICGDLFFSFIKRKHNIKDFSNLIPGHGGLLDRIDGMIFALILAYIINIRYV